MKTYLIIGHLEDCEQAWAVICALSINDAATHFAAAEYGKADLDALEEAMLAEAVEGDETDGVHAFAVERAVQHWRNHETTENNVPDLYIDHVFELDGSVENVTDMLFV